jgi:hypothetical protein
MTAVSIRSVGRLLKIPLDKNHAGQEERESQKCDAGERLIDIQVDQ